MTNADKIRTMNDDELARWLGEALSGGREWFEARSCERCQAENAGRCPVPEGETCGNTGSEIMDWLKAEN